MKPQQLLQPQVLMLQARKNVIMMFWCIQETNTAVHLDTLAHLVWPLTDSNGLWRARQMTARLWNPAGNSIFEMRLLTEVTWLSCTTQSSFIKKKSSIWECGWTSSEFNNLIWRLFSTEYSVLMSHPGMGLYSINKSRVQLCLQSRFSGTQSTLFELSP